MTDKALTSLTQGTADTGDFVYGTVSGNSRKLQVGPLMGAVARERLTADRTYYVRPDGSDSNNGLANTSGGAFLTQQKAWDVVTQTLDLAGYTVTIKLADGTYTAGILEGAAAVVGGTVIVEGNTSTPANVIVNRTGSVLSDACYDFQASEVELRGITIRTTTIGHGIFSREKAVVSIGAGMVLGPTVNAAMEAVSNGVINIKADYTATGGGEQHMAAVGGGIIDFTGGDGVSARTVTVSGTPNYSVQFALVRRGGKIRLSNSTFSGSATGKRFTQDSGGVLHGMSGLTHLPGNVAGTFEFGGNVSLNGQIAFPATANPSTDANTLDDYEEGTWTATLTFVTAGDLSVVYDSTRAGVYVKVGQLLMVHWSILTTTFTHTTASGALRVTGLPFASSTFNGSGVGQRFGALDWGGITKASYTQVCAAVDYNATYAIFPANGSGVASSLVTAADMPTGGTVRLRGGGCYQTET